MGYGSNTFTNYGYITLPGGRRVKENTRDAQEYLYAIGRIAKPNWLTYLHPQYQKLRQATEATQVNGNPADKYMKAYEDAYNKAKQANESRYQEILQGYQQRYGRGMDYINQLSNQQEMDAREAGAMRMSNMNQDLVSRGLTGTTIKPVQEALVNRETDANVRRIQDAKLREKLTTDAGLSGDTLGFMERREDVYPDMGMYANLMNQYGRYGSSPTVRKIGGTRRTNGGNSHSNYDGLLWQDPERTRDPETGRWTYRQGPRTTHRTSTSAYNPMSYAGTGGSKIYGGTGYGGNSSISSLPSNNIRLSRSDYYPSSWAEPEMIYGNQQPLYGNGRILTRLY